MEIKGKTKVNRKEKVDSKNLSVKPKVIRNDDVKVSFEAPAILSQALNQYVKKRGLVKKTVIVAALVEYLKANDPVETSKWLSE